MIEYMLKTATAPPTNVGNRNRTNQGIRTPCPLSMPDSDRCALLAPNGPSSQTASQIRHHRMLRQAKVISAALQPWETIMIVSSGADSVLDNDEHAVIHALGIPRFSGACQE